MVAPLLVGAGHTRASTPAGDPSRLASVVVAMLAFPGGVIHAAVIHHRFACRDEPPGPSPRAFAVGAPLAAAPAGLADQDHG